MAEPNTFPALPNHARTRTAIRHHALCRRRWSLHPARPDTSPEKGYHLCDDGLAFALNTAPTGRHAGAAGDNRGGLHWY